MRRPTTLFLLLLCLLAALHAPARADDEADSPRDQVIRGASDIASACLALLAEQDRAKEQIASAVGTAGNRITTVSQAIAVLEKPYSEPDHASYQRQAQESAQRVASLRAMLDGEAVPQEPGLTRASLLASLAQALQKYEQFTTLRDTAAIEMQAERADRCGQLKAELDQLQDAIDHDSRPLVKALQELIEQASEQGDDLARAMQPFGLLGEDTGLGIQAVQLSAMPLQLGRIQVQWTDGRGRDVAAAMLMLVPQPDTHEAPPDILDRFHTLAASEGKVEASVGFFRVDFETSAEGVVNEPDVIALLTALLDLDALGDIQPRQENSGLN